jgi:hypothetical protein
VSAKKGDFDPGKFLATVGEEQQVLSFARTQTIFTQGKRLTQSSTFRKVTLDSPSYPSLARKRLSAY